MQDEYALQSQLRYAAAVEAGKFADEIVPMDTRMLHVDKESGEQSEVEVSVDRTSATGRTRHWGVWPVCRLPLKKTVR